MEFDKRQAQDLIADALTMNMVGAWQLGLVSAFYMCELLTHEEWQDMLTRIPTAARL
jgi:fluoride ion exporter CrcB/FEX